MANEIVVPTLGESVSEAQLVQWLKQDGDHISEDEPLCELETDKANVVVPAPGKGVVRIQKQAGETVRVGETIATIESANASSKTDTNGTPPQTPSPPAEKKLAATQQSITAPRPDRESEDAVKSSQTNSKVSVNGGGLPASPTSPPRSGPPATPTSSRPVAAAPAKRQTADGLRREPMSRLRKRIAERLVRAKNATAMLTTFNEVDVSAVQEIRARHQEQFKKRHGVSLGLMSFFAKAATTALLEYPLLNAQLDGDDIVFNDHVHLGVAVSTERGLVVPVLPDADGFSLVKLEQEIKRVATLAREGKLDIDALSNGTFTITNGGVFGSLLSTPILNPPQSSILGMHTIQDRPVARQGQVVIRPMMYLALSYDHRLIDGSDAVSFLVRIKQLIEDPMEFVLGI